jgi:hypothetical protein
MACWFIEASTVFVREIATGEVRPNFRQRRIVAFTAACCYAKSTPVALQCSDRTARGVEAFVRKLESAFSKAQSTAAGPAARQPKVAPA